VPGLTPLSAGTETLTPLVEIVGAPSYLIPGLLPASSLFPGATTFPRDYVIVPAVDGPVLGALPAATLTLTPLTED
jgi:hypothetical protein